MIRYLMASELENYPILQETMFQDRADQFKRRLGWEVIVSENGWEQDEYDALNPLYVVCEAPDGRHLGSMRFLPSTGPTMIQDHFAHLLNGRSVSDPTIWECTRFCLGAHAGPLVAGRLMSAGGEILKGFGLSGFAGVFDQRMVRIYRRIGAGPEILGSEGTGRDKISVGIWRFSDGARSRVARRSGLSEGVVGHWFRRAFSPHPISPFLDRAEGLPV